MPRRRDTRERIVGSAHKLFYRRGFTRVGVDEIAAAAGVTKRTLYQHFESKDALLAAALESADTASLGHIDAWAGDIDGTPDAIVVEIFEKALAWSRTRRWTGPGFTRLAMELADLPGHPARAVAKRHKATLERRITERFARGRAETATRDARNVVLLLEGGVVLALLHGDPRYIEDAGRAALALLRLGSDDHRPVASSASSTSSKSP